MYLEFIKVLDYVSHICLLLYMLVGISYMYMDHNGTIIHKCITLECNVTIIQISCRNHYLATYLMGKHGGVHNLIIDLKYLRQSSYRYFIYAITWCVQYNELNRIQLNNYDF